MKAEYRNSVRSRRLICDALLELLAEKPLSKITVTDIANRANVNRGTFYLHYVGISDVIDELQDELIAQMGEYFLHMDIPFNPDNIMIISAECLKFAYAQSDSKYIPLLYHQQLHLTDKLCRTFQQQLRVLKEIPQDEQSQKELLIRASILAHGIVGIFNASASGALDVSKERIIASIDGLVADIQQLQMQKQQKAVPPAK